MRFKNWKPPKMKHGKFTKWNWVPYHPKNIRMGRNTDIGAFTCLFAHYGITIGDDAQIGSHCSIYSLNTENDVKGKVIIKDKACIGSHCVIFPNVVIEKEELIPAGSVVYVNKDGERIVKKVIRQSR